MKVLKWLVAMSLFLGVAYAFIIVDRDRSMWVLNTVLKTVAPREAVEDIAYGKKPWQTLDVYPAIESPTAPVVVFIHGGGWYHGRKDQYYFAADAFLRAGYTVVVPDYTKFPSPHARFPAHVDDIALAIAWTQAHISKHRGDADHVFIAGHSAGAHTAALVTTNRRYLEQVGIDVAYIKGVAAIAGPYRFTPDKEATRAVFGPESNYPRMNPLAYVDGDEPPVLILHSDIDKSIANHHPREFEQAMRAVNGDVQLAIYDHLTHADMVTHLHPWFAGGQTLAVDIDTFFRKQLPAQNPTLN